MFEMVRRAGGLQFVIGMVGRSPEGPVVEGGIRPQTRRSLERIEAVLAEGAGRSRKDIVRLRFYLTDMRQWPEARDEIVAFFGEPMPTGDRGRRDPARRARDAHRDRRGGGSRVSDAAPAVDPWTRQRASRGRSGSGC